MAKLRVKQLLRAMKDTGLSCSMMWLRYAEMQGKLKCPTLPNSRGDRVFTQKQIDEIVQAFSPGGKGKWQP